MARITTLAFAESPVVGSTAVAVVSDNVRLTGTASRLVVTLVGSALVAVTSGAVLGRHRVSVVPGVTVFAVSSVGILLTEVAVSR